MKHREVNLIASAKRVMMKTKMMTMMMMMMMMIMTLITASKVNNIKIVTYQAIIQRLLNLTRMNKLNKQACKTANLTSDKTPIKKPKMKSMIPRVS